MTADRCFAKWARRPAGVPGVPSTDGRPPRPGAAPSPSPDPAVSAGSQPSVVGLPHTPARRPVAGTPGTLGTPAVQPDDIRAAAEIGAAERVTLLAANGMSEDWIAGLAQLLAAGPPPGVSLHRWRQWQSAADRFLGRWGRTAHGLGWTTLNVFGVSQAAPDARHDLKGIVAAMEDHDVVALTATDAVLDVRGQRLRFTRRPPEPGQVALWDLIDKEETEHE